MKKIALILPTEPEDGGQHQYALVVVKCLMEKMNTDYDLIAICENSFWRNWCRKHNIKQSNYCMPKCSEKERKFNLRFPAFAQIYNTYFTPFGKFIREQKIDILFSLQQGRFVPNYMIKIITPVHDLMHRYEPDFEEISRTYKSREIYSKCIAKYTTCILTDSKLGGRQFVESYIKGYRKGPHIVSMPFIVPEHIWDTKEEAITVPDKYIFYPAQFWKHKNHIHLLHAIKLIKNDIKDIHLVLVGSEKNNGKEIKKYIADNDLNDHITIMGFVSDENITYLYKHAVGMVMPSYFGPTNIPPLEAMALGCPVAVSKKYAMPEQVGKAGLLFDPDSPEEIADCIKKLWTDEALREKMKKLGYQRVQRWTRCEFGEKLYKVINAM